MTRTWKRLIRSTSGTSAVEFALVLPLFLILLLGTIDAGRFLWEYNEAEKATQVGARVAIVTDVLAPGLRDENYAGQTVNGVKIASGGRIPAGALGTIVCNSTTCTCETTPCPSNLGTFDSTIFTNVLLARMQAIDPAIQAENVEVRYSGSGLGTAGTAGGGGGGGTETLEISPLVTVTLKDMTFTPITSLLFASIPMPDLHTTLTAEDASGEYSN
jgi:Flp pilus assembly protein TadG